MRHRISAEENCEAAEAFERDVLVPLKAPSALDTRSTVSAACGGACALS